MRREEAETLAEEINEYTGKRPGEAFSWRPVYIGTEHGIEPVHGGGPIYLTPEQARKGLGL